MSEPNSNRALVIGGSIAGLLAARILADHFSQVTLIERDHFPDEPAFRAGVPQGRHIHLMLMRGQQILDQLFPGLTKELEAAGAPRLDLFKESRTYTAFGWCPRFSSDFWGITCSRELLEWGIRQRVAALANVRVLAGYEAIGLVPNAQKTGVAGARVRLRSADTHTPGPEEELAADLVVDASGRDSKAPEWLEALGYARPPETVINSFPGYASRCYQRPENFQGDWQLLGILYKPPEFKRGGVIIPLEGNRWLVTLGGAARDYPPTDEAGFLEYARSMPVPHLYDAIKDAQPLSPIYGYQRMENRLRHYERLARWPDGLVIFGDAVCAFNPYYGQGMTVAAQSALALDQCLREQRQRLPNGDLAGLGRRFQKVLAKITATPWLMATGEDFRSPETEGGRPGFLTRLTFGYTDGVKMLTIQSASAYRIYTEVAHLLKPPAVLFRPGIAFGVLRQLLTRRKTKAAA